MRKWISLVSVAGLGDEVADGLLRLPLLRAMFCELIGKNIGMFRETNQLFLLGLLSVMDALLNVRMVDVLAEIPVDDELKKPCSEGSVATGQSSKLYSIMSRAHGKSWRTPLVTSVCMKSFCRIYICIRSVG
ncbi:MAG TPA: hypothetical protein VMH20_00315 [Verrucomicrobiae bacterium]|nr:hypothetical protein [Verrucomicrobiae bacterium]